MLMTDISIIVPVYNEAENIAPLLDAITRAFTATDSVYEVILIDDGSADDTPKIIREHAAKDRRVKLVGLRRNFGQTAAMMAGIDRASGKIIVPMDGDLQNDPADIHQLIEKIDEGYDVVSGWRRNRKDDWARTLASRCANRMISWISGVHLHDYGCSLKAYRREVIEDVRLYGEMHRFVPIYATWQGAKVTEIEVNHRARRAGVSKYGFDRTLKVIFDLLVVQFLMRYETKPIHVFGMVGFMTILASFLAGILAVYLRVVEGISLISTPLPLLAALSFLTGIICILMGLIAELLIRVYYESQGKRVYTLKGAYNFDKSADERGAT